jgi:hypothetical protein
MITFFPLDEQEKHARLFVSLPLRLLRRFGKGLRASGRLKIV